MLTRSQAAFKIEDITPSEVTDIIITKKDNVQKCDEESERKSKSMHNLPSNVPTPAKFDEFLPWGGKLWGIEETIIVNRHIQEDYIFLSKRKAASKQRKFNVPLRSLSTISSGTQSNKVTATQVTSETQQSSVFKKASVDDELPDGLRIPINAIYNTRGFLVAISIINCEEIIPQKLMKLISLTLPFQKNLNKLTIRKSRLSQGIIYEISEMLTCSNITEVCLDDNYVRQGNYYILLDKLTSLKILSLNRCSINEVVCEDIVKRLDPGRPGDKLQSLSLSSNFIGDIGARLFGDLLRRNRSLLHLNLADNGITNEGATAILRNLQEFEVNTDEIYKKRKKKHAYLKLKIKVYESLLLRKQRSNIRRKTFSHTTRKRKPAEKKESQLLQSHTDPLKSSDTVQDVRRSANSLATDILGKFMYFYDENNTVRKDDKLFGIGNMNLCYLNLAYNDLDEMILKTIIKVLTYQAALTKPLLSTGLLRLVIEGNALRNDNLDLEQIRVILVKTLQSCSTAIK